jgi:hypothetical protein
MTQHEWNIRPATGGDLPFIYDSFRSSFRTDSDFGQSFSKFNQSYNENFNRHIDDLLAHPDCQVYVPCRLNDEEIIFGYLISQKELLHYAFMKKAFRRKGIFKSLMEAAGHPGIFTHRTYSFQPIINRNPQLTYNPFLMFQGRTENYGPPSEDLRKSPAHVCRA